MLLILLLLPCLALARALALLLRPVRLAPSEKKTAASARAARVLRLSPRCGSASPCFSLFKKSLSLSVRVPPVFAACCWLKAKGFFAPDR